MDELVCMERSYIVVEDGRIAGVFRTLPERYAQLPVLDYGESRYGYGAAGMAEYLYLPGGIQI